MIRTKLFRTNCATYIRKSLLLKLSKVLLLVVIKNMAGLLEPGWPATEPVRSAAAHRASKILSNRLPEGEWASELHLSG